MLTLVRATLLKNLRLRGRGRWTLAIEVFSTTVMLFAFYLIDRFQSGLVGDRLKNALEGMDTTYFGYVALGLAVSELSTSNLGGVLGQFQEDKRLGTLEMHIAAGIGIRSWGVGAGAVNFFRSIFQFALIYGVAVGVLGLKLPVIRYELVALVLLVAIVPLWALSLISLSSVLLMRRGNVFGFLISIGFELFSGVYVPLSVFPDWLRPFTELLPITPALRAMQTLFYKNGQFSDIHRDLLLVAVQGAIILPLALALLRITDVHAKRKGYYVLD